MSADLHFVINEDENSRKTSFALKEKRNAEFRAGISGYENFAKNRKQGHLNGETLLPAVVFAEGFA
jgi:hypothetical protein